MQALPGMKLMSDLVHMWDLSVHAVCAPRLPSDMDQREGQQIM